jgi:hypothetical protein
MMLMNGVPYLSCAIRRDASSMVLVQAAGELDPVAVPAMREAFDGTLADRRPSRAEAALGCDSSVSQS